MAAPRSLRSLGNDAYAVRLFSCDGYLRVKIRFADDSYRSGGGRRGRIYSFSPASRLRLMSLLARLDWTGGRGAVFITLTLPDDVWPAIAKRRTQPLYLWHRYAERSAKAHLPAVWRVEWKKRQSGSHEGTWVPHWHWCVFTDWLDKEDIRQWWRQATQTESVDLCTDVERIDGEHAARYICKYTTKDDDSLSTLDNGAYLNRAWACRRKAELPLKTVRIIEELGDGSLFRLMDQVSSDPELAGKVYAKGCQGFRVFGTPANRHLAEWEAGRGVQTFEGFEETPDEGETYPPLPY